MKRKNKEMKRKRGNEEEGEEEEKGEENIHHDTMFLNPTRRNQKWKENTIKKREEERQDV